MPADGVARWQPKAKQPDTTRNSLAAPRSRSSSPTMAHRPRILFLARRYPPTIGGIQTHCHALYTRLANQAQVRLVALGRQSLLHLIWFLPYCFAVAFWAVLGRRVDAVYFADGVAASLAPLLRPLGPARFVTTVYGLEMTYKNPLARALMHWGVRACDKVVVISEHSRRITAASGVPEAKLEIIYLGVEPLELALDELAAVRARFEQEHGLRFGQDRILLLFGRQVPRKGMVEFLAKGMPLLDADIRLLICGPPASETARLQECCQSGLKDRVTLLGPIPRRCAGHAAHQLRSFPHAQPPPTRRCRRLRPDPTRMYVRWHPSRGLCRRCPDRERARRRISR